MCVRARAWVRAGARLAWVGECARACVSLLIQHVTRMRHIVSSLVTRVAPLYFSALSQTAGFSEKTYRT